MYENAVAMSNNLDAQASVQILEMSNVNADNDQSGAHAGWHGGEACCLVWRACRDIVLRWQVSHW